MSVLLFLIPLSVLFAAGFFAAFLWSVKSGQYRDTVTPPLRVLLEETNVPKRKQEKSSSSRRQPQT
ncbi:MAG: cbb3-type cytochrome oxidase assembly protein CcoS [Verrucomicrobia bacterium]|nr:cbb3-type cytochrome oxidase assembly protein CcoS [Verrucomicrobiota bacterium]